jgi:DNA-binding MarR family transcriptional regulator
MEELSHADFQQLLAFRTALRGFLRWSEDQARAAGLTPAQHQLLLAIIGHDDARGPTIGESADYLLLRHHSTVELAARAESAGLVERTPDPDDHRLVRLVLTETGRAHIEALAELHLQELQRLGPILEHLTTTESAAPPQ